MKPINTEKISVNSLIWIRNLQWRRKELFRWERSGHLKTIKQAPPAGGPFFSMKNLGMKILEILGENRLDFIENAR